MAFVNITESKFFDRAVTKAFDELDADGTGTIDEGELIIGVYVMFNIVNKHIPCHVDPPQRAEITKMFRVYFFDKARKGQRTMNRDEFRDFAKTLFETRIVKSGIVPLALRTLATGTVLVPLVAYVAKRAVASAVGPPLSTVVKGVPTAVLAPLIQFGIANAGKGAV